jgi:uncharacterized BrkB/YihY/UPF0761 family membrane protein
VLDWLAPCNGFAAPRRRSSRIRSPSSCRCSRRFRANQGLLLSGGVAYYTLLSIVPLLILLVIVLSHVIAADELLATLARYLELVAPGQSARSWRTCGSSSRTAP